MPTSRTASNAVSGLVAGIPGIANGMAGHAATTRSAFQYWRGLCQERAMPGWSEFDPGAVPRLLPHLIMARCVLEDLDFEFRVIGNHIRDRIGGNYVGTRVTERHPEQSGSTILGAYRTVLFHGEPVLLHTSYVGPIRELSGTEGLFLPWSDDAGVLSHILVAITFKNDRRILIERNR